MAVGPEYTQLLRDGNEVKFRPFDFAIDYYGRVLYWTDTKFGAILAVGIDRPPDNRTHNANVVSAHSYSSAGGERDGYAERNDEPVMSAADAPHSRATDDELNANYDMQNEGGDRDNDEGDARARDLEGPTEGPPVEDVVPRRVRPNHYPMPHVSLIYKSREKDIEPQLIKLSLATGYMMCTTRIL